MKRGLASAVAFTSSNNDGDIGIEFQCHILKIVFLSVDELLAKLEDKAEEADYFHS